MACCCQQDFQVSKVYDVRDIHIKYATRGHVTGKVGKVLAIHMCRPEFDFQCSSQKKASTVIHLRIEEAEAGEFYGLLELVSSRFSGRPCLKNQGGG